MSHWSTSGEEVTKFLIEIWSNDPNDNIFWVLMERARKREYERMGDLHHLKIKKLFILSELLHSFSSIHFNSDRR